MRTGKRGKSFRRAFAASFRVGEFGRKKSSALGLKQNYIMETLSVGERKTFKHKNGHVLGSGKFLSPIVHNVTQYLLYECDEVNVDQIVDYRILKTKAFDGASLPTSTNNQLMKARRSTGAYSEAASMSSKTSTIGSKPYRRKNRERGTARILITNNSLQFYEVPKHLK